MFYVKFFPFPHSFQLHYIFGIFSRRSVTQRFETAMRPSESQTHNYKVCCCLRSLVRAICLLQTYATASELLIWWRAIANEMKSSNVTATARVLNARCIISSITGLNDWTHFGFYASINRFRLCWLHSADFYLSIGACVVMFLNFNLPAWGKTFTIV